MCKSLSYLKSYGWWTNLPPKLPSNVKGIRGAMEVYGRLLEAGLEVYVPVMYIRHDAVVKTPAGGHIDIEIKSRAAGETGFVVGKNMRPRPDFFFILHYEGTDESWVLPSDVARKHVAGSGDRIILGDAMKQSLHPYKNAYYMIVGAGSKNSRMLAQSTGRVSRKHLKQADYEKEVLKILAESGVPMSSKEIIAAIFKRLGPRFSPADQEPLSRGRLRWEGTARFAIYQGLKPRGLIEAKAKNQWTLSTKGRESID